MLKLVPLLKEKFSFYVYSGSEFTLLKCERFCFFLFIISGLYLLFFKKSLLFDDSYNLILMFRLLDTIAKTIFLQAETEKQERRDDGTLNDSR